MLKINNEEYFDSVVSWAIENNIFDSLKEQLDYLDGYSGGVNECHLYKDFAPKSFYFEMVKPGGAPWFNGGLIFHGPHDHGGDGGMPTLSVCVNPDDKPHWSVHT